MLEERIVKMEVDDRITVTLKLSLAQLIKLFPDQVVLYTDEGYSITAEQLLQHSKGAIAFVEKEEAEGRAEGGPRDINVSISPDLQDIIEVKGETPNDPSKPIEVNITRKS